MADITARKQRLRTLENQIREDYEAFVRAGFALMEIRDDELYDEAGFETWERYLKERVAVEFGIERTQAFQLIACAQIRTKLPEPPKFGTPNLNDSKPEWTQSAVYEFGRLAPKNEALPGHPPDFDKLNKRDVERVAKKVFQHCEKEETKPTATIVRKFVDQELGVDRAAQAKETRRQREEDERPLLHQYLIDMTGRIEAETEKLGDELSPEVWKSFRKLQPHVVKRLTTAVNALANLLERLDG